MTNDLDQDERIAELECKVFALEMALLLVGSTMPPEIRDKYEDGLKQYLSDNAWPVPCMETLLRLLEGPKGKSE